MEEPFITNTMENLFLFLATSLVLRIPKPKFKRYIIGNSGCSSFLPNDRNLLHIQRTKDGDRIYFNESNLRNVTYGLITVQMKDVFTLKQAEEILVQYINRCRKPFGISYNISMQVENAAGKIVITDYWQDEKSIDWKVKGYTDGKTLALLYVKNITNAPVKDHDDFLNSFRFPSFF